MRDSLIFPQDVNLPNTLLRGDGKISLIDLEYAGPNHAAYDIANLFNEYAGTGEHLDFVRDYPNEEFCINIQFTREKLQSPYT